VPNASTSAFGEVFGDLTVTTARAINPETNFHDNVSQHVALYRELNARGRKRMDDGGLEIREDLDFTENPTYTRYSGDQPLNLTRHFPLTAAVYPYRSIAMHIMYTGEEMSDNSGAARIKNLVKSRVTNGYRSFRNQLSRDCYSLGTLENQIGGMQFLISDTGGGIVGGIDSGTWSVWKNYVHDLSALGITPSATNWENDVMLPVWMNTHRGDDEAMMWVMANDYYKFFEGSQTSFKRYAPDDDGAAGFTKMLYKGARVYHDTGGSGIPASRAYALNLDYLALVARTGRDVTVQDEKESFNQDLCAIPIFFRGNLVCSNRSLQAVILP